MADITNELKEIKAANWGGGIRSAIASALQKVGEDTLPAIEEGDNGKVLTIVEGEWAKAEASGGGLPDVTSSDNGKVPTVVSGEWDLDKPKDSRFFVVTGTYSNNTISGSLDGVGIGMCIHYGLIGILTVAQKGAGLIYYDGNNSKAIIPSINASKAFVINGSSSDKTWTLEA